MTPHIARFAEAVQHYHCRATAADPHMDGCTVGFDRPRLHHSREGINPIYVGMLAHLFNPGLGACRTRECELGHRAQADSGPAQKLSLIHISEPTRLGMISY